MKNVLLGAVAAMGCIAIAVVGWWFTAWIIKLLPWPMSPLICN